MGGLSHAIYWQKIMMAVTQVLFMRESFRYTGLKEHSSNIYQYISHVSEV